MDKAIAEWNGRVVYYLVFALLAVIVGYLWVRYFRRRYRLACTYCGRRLHKRSKFKDVVEGMPRTFCNRKCCEDYREKGPLPVEERQVLRANELIEDAVR